MRALTLLYDVARSFTSSLELHEVLGRITQLVGTRLEQQVRWLESHGRFLYDAAGAPLRLVGVSTDVTERVRFEELRARRDEIAEHPELQDELRADRDRIPNFLEEMLRVESPVKASAVDMLVIRETSEGMFAGLDDRVEVDSAGTAAYHVGDDHAKFRKCGSAACGRRGGSSI